MVFFPLKWLQGRQGVGISWVDGAEDKKGNAMGGKQ